MKRITDLIHSSTNMIVQGLLLGSLLCPAVMFAQDSTAKTHNTQAKLVQDVREVTQQYINVNNAVQAGYLPTFGCVTGPAHGAMGIHYVNSTLVADGELHVNAPEALIYEPIGNKRRLVGVEYIVDSATWLANHDNNPPVMEGQDFQFVAAPNRFNLDSFFELHVWAWQDNPQGAFVDWNNDVSCENQ